MKPRLLALGLLASSAAAPAADRDPAGGRTADDPIALVVNHARFTRSEVFAAGGADGPGRGVERLVRRALLLQEARALKMEAGLPEGPDQRAEAFLDGFFAPDTVCNGFPSGALDAQYARMKPRYVHGPLVTVQDLLYVCGTPGDPEEIACRRAAHDLAEQSWAPIAPDVRSADELAVLQAAHVSHPLAVVERTFETEPAGSAGPATGTGGDDRLSLTTQPDGQGYVETGLFGARLRVIVSRRAAQQRGLDDPAVRREVEAELCTAHRARAKEDYVRSIAAVARIEIVPGVLPDPGPRTPRAGPR